jgi:hypothetical protein
MRITVPLSEFRDGWSEQAKAKPLIEVPVDSEHDAVSIDVFLGERGAPSVRIESAFPIAHIERGDRGQVEVVAYSTTIGELVHDVFSTQISEMRAGLKDQGWDGVSVIRAVIFGYDEDAGFLREMEIAIGPEG